ncbi:ATP adenylyltransferase-domain-containing protein [Xylaria bambusicola]|uniref:ATP adenylyltransferase-domain-containing protein n=1 Tax=Xylaria bambusicola TaxID=326684 RepID=UPI002007523E|nr:ATP adenylyltransferase-domain-containing protein [Xylaria bambusicola]KAI0528016.1 ATP adenylyltransferase-domain-containing protein [Xylaria bambusicola]
MPPLTAPPNLPALVRDAFIRAQGSGDLIYYPTQVAIVTIGSLTFQLRYSPALAQKPKPPKPVEPNARPFNPFENPSPALLVAQLPPSHRLILNKFAIVPEHFILATRDFKPQTHLLEPGDIDAAYACVQAYRSADQDLFVFFNSGDHSGASQPHRHLQLLPVDCMKLGLENTENGSEWAILADKVHGNQEALPFTVFTSPISAEMSAEDRHLAYLSLYKRAVHAAMTNVEAVDEGEAQISYNFAMTNTCMALCPRTAEGTAVKDSSGNKIGDVSLNGTVLAGTALVKNQAEWDALRTNTDMLHGVLEGIGIPSKMV